MTRRLARLSDAARAWLLKEIAYIAARDPKAAQKIVAQFRTARRNLAAFPRMAQPGLIPGTRRLVVGDYILTVRQRSDEVDVVSIRHARQADAYAPRDVAADEGSSEES
jgi:plasmid stabilization system protein ParE